MKNYDIIMSVTVTILVMLFLIIGICVYVDKLEHCLMDSKCIELYQNERKNEIQSTKQKLIPKSTQVILFGGK